MNELLCTVLIHFVKDTKLLLWNAFRKPSLFNIAVYVLPAIFIK